MTVLTAAWMPRLACPECRAELGVPADEYVACPACDRVFERRGGVWRFLTPARGVRLDPFVQQFRAVREREGRRPASPEYYQRLPSVAADDPHAADWSIRRESYHHLLRHVLAAGPLPIHALDVGAGSAWLCHRLVALGHQAVAVDAVDDEVDGLGAARHYPTTFPMVQADFDALPFAAGQFGLIVFNGSLHYAADIASTLASAHRLLAPGGTLAVMDSPMFRADRDGAAMVDDSVRRFVVDCGLCEVVIPGPGYLTFSRLAAIAERLKLRPEFLPSRGPLGWRVRRQLARVKLRRAPAAFGLWVAR
jgi:SAM-dependent methyltransferase